MANSNSLIKRITHFFNYKLWSLRLDKLDKKRGFFLFLCVPIFMYAILYFFAFNFALLCVFALKYGEL